MVNVGILDGDYILVEQRPTAENGEIVVALVEDGATVKRFFKRTDTTGFSRRMTPWIRSLLMKLRFSER